MARITVIGAGLNGLATALLLARDGHSVTVLERDAGQPEGDANGQWQNWERPGVSQFRLPHIMQALWRRLMEQELPEVIDELERLGGIRLSPLDTLPPEVTGGVRPGDEDLRVMLARRPVVEGALAAVAARTPGVTVRRGARAEALVAAADASGVPHVNGVVIDGGETVPADLVVDAMGATPRSTGCSPASAPSVVEAIDPAAIPPALRARIEAANADGPGYPPAGPTRAQLLAAVAEADQPAESVA